MGYEGRVALTPISPNKVFQRDSRAGDPGGNWTTRYGRGWTTVDLAISPTAAFQVLEYRVRDAGSPAAPPLLDWTLCSGPAPPGPVVVSLSLPAALGWFLIDVRAEADDNSVETTSAVGVGEVIAASGQSLASDFWSNIATGDSNSLSALGIAPTPYGVCYAAWDGYPPPAANAAWSPASGSSTYNSAFCAEFLRLAVSGTGVNCALVGYAWSGEPITSWRDDSSGPKDAWTPLVTTLDAAVNIGGRIGTFIWMHGHNDARIPQAGIDGDELSSDGYLAALARLVGALAARYSARPFSRILSSIPAIGANWITGSPRFAPFYIQQIRAAHLRFAAGDSLTMGHVDGLDVALWSDQTHPSQLGNIVFARHFYRAFMQSIDSAAYPGGDTGPRLTGAASRPVGGSQIHLGIAQNRGTGLTCSGGAAGAATQFQVFKSGSTAPSDQFAVVAVDLSSSNTITLSLALAPPDHQLLDVWYRLPPDSNATLLTANQIYDNDTSGYVTDHLTTGRQLSTRPSAINVPAPIGLRPMYVAPGVLLNVAVAMAGLTA